MEQVTITLPESLATQVKSVAIKSGVSIEDFLLASVQDRLERLDPDFTKAINYVVTKNAELYKRLT